MNGFEVQTEADAMIDRQRKEILPNLTTPSKTSLSRPESGDVERIIDPTIVDTVEDDNNYAVFVSYIEIYNNYVYDLLEELPYNAITGYKPPQTKILRTDSTDNMYVHNCTEVEVKQPQDAIDVFYKGQRRRKVAHTTLNAESSRSHSVFNIRLVQAPLDDRGEEVIQDSNRLCVSQLSLVDLAGSERTNRTKNSGDRLKEAGNINQSLMVLRNCLEILRDNQKSGVAKHVMKFAEMTQEVLITKSEQGNKFDLGLTPGRRRMHQEQLERQQQEVLLKPALPAPLPPVDFLVGPPFPILELINPTDDTTIRNIIQCLNERMRRKQEMTLEYERSCSAFREQLVEFEKSYGSIKSKLMDLEEKTSRQEKESTRLEAKNKSLERKLNELSRQLKDAEKENQLLNLQVQDKTWKIQVEKNSKDKMRMEYRNRLQLNNEVWEKNLEKAKRQFEIEAGTQLEERDRKLEMLRDLVNDEMVATPRARSRVPPQPMPKPRTYTTPSARSETDMGSIASSAGGWSARSAVVTPAGRAGNTRVQSRTTSRIAAAKSIPNLNQVGTTSTPTPSVASRSRQPVVNPRYHRRSKSSGNADTWLEHKPSDSISTSE
ncbi:kinesin-like protein [Elysia marginata]|uniref:Kinesin-like protein n=1 Tax=Elysia marginata TaxID=1093978 RepID=A0AAV4HTM0_9GAST|nr:kinesin-like protein [Elysia marginata]